MVAVIAMVVGGIAGFWAWCAAVDWFLRGFDNGHVYGAYSKNHWKG